MKKSKAKPDSGPTPVQIRRVVLAAVGMGIVFAALVNWESLIPGSRKPTVDVFWTHDCTCVFEWMEELKGAGLHVRSFEAESLALKRKSMHVPSDLKGCHLGQYEGYFVEGHVPPSAITQLGAQHPTGRGLVLVPEATDSSKPATEDYRHGNVMLFGDTGEPRLWAVAN